MSRHYGPIFQVAYVVKDFEAALRHWTEVVGVGPFYLFPQPIPFTRLELRGVQQSDTQLTAQAALAYSGETQIEIILPGSMPSPYHEFLASGRKGMHHIGVDCLDFDAQLKHATDSGIEAVVGRRAAGIPLRLPGHRRRLRRNDAGAAGAGA